MLFVLALCDLDQCNGEDASDHDSRKECMLRYLKAEAVIGLSLSNEYLEHRSSVCSGKEMWETNLDVFQIHTLLTKSAARQKFYNIPMAARHKVLAFLNCFKQLAGTLKVINVNVDDKETAMVVLHRLPSSDEHFIVGLDTIRSKGHFFTFGLVKCRLKQDEQRSAMLETKEKWALKSLYLWVMEVHTKSAFVNRVPFS